MFKKRERPKAIQNFTCFDLMIFSVRCQATRAREGEGEEETTVAAGDLAAKRCTQPRIFGPNKMASSKGKQHLSIVFATSFLFY